MAAAGYNLVVTAGVCDTHKRWASGADGKSCQTKIPVGGSHCFKRRYMARGRQCGNSFRIMGLRQWQRVG